MARFRPWRAAAAIACGHLLSMAVVALALVLRLPPGRAALQWGAAVLLLALLVRHYRQHRAMVGGASLALWTFIASTAHGAGFVLMPALATLCGTGSSRPLLQLLAAAGAHLAAMLAVNGAIAYIAFLFNEKLAR